VQSALIDHLQGIKELAAIVADHLVLPLELLIDFEPTVPEHLRAACRAICRQTYPLSPNQ
jgi:hypothetical protein